MIEAGANPKDVQGQMRHTKIAATMDIYAQFLPQSARRAMEKTREMVEPAGGYAEVSDRSSAVNWSRELWSQLEPNDGYGANASD